jgi:hypothetical protein
MRRVLFDLSFTTTVYNFLIVHFSDACFYTFIQVDVTLRTCHLCPLAHLLEFMSEKLELVTLFTPVHGAVRHNILGQF